MGVRRSYPFVWLGASLAVIVLFAVAPFISLLVAGAMADALGCTLPLSHIPPCPFMGADWGETLTVMAYVGYFAFWTLPTGALALAIWLLVVGTVTFMWWWRRRREA